MTPNTYVLWYESKLFNIKNSCQAIQGMHFELNQSVIWLNGFHLRLVLRSSLRSIALSQDMDIIGHWVL